MKKELVKVAIKERFEEYLKKTGFKMQKTLSSGHSGFLSYSAPTYDRRTVYSIDELFKLNKEGFTASSDEMQVFVFNMLATW